MVLLYDFFSSSRLAHNARWRLLRHHLVHLGLLPPEATAPGGSHACPSFDPRAHALMAPELKALYVAVTRAREDVVVVESSVEAYGPVLELWNRRGLVDVREELGVDVSGGWGQGAGAGGAGLGVHG